MEYFITGIDTNIGKTYATAMLARYLVLRKCRVITQKMVQTGNDGYSEDRDFHRAVMGCGEFPEDREGLTCPEIFRFPASPHLAAELENRELSLEKISAATKILAKRYDYVLIEGAGGAAVPLCGTFLTADYVAREKYPVLLVTSGRLGSLNHTIMTLEMFASRGVEVRALLYHVSPSDDEIIARDSRRKMLEYMKKYGYCETLIELAHGRDIRDGQLPDCKELFGV